MNSFVHWYKEVCVHLQQNGKLKKLEAEFNAQTSDFGRVSVLYQHKDCGSDLEKSYEGKSNKKSEHHRSNGNKFYSRKEYYSALLAYSTSISYADGDSNELSLAYANRSAVLYALGEYGLAQDDIDLAFKKDYPIKLHYKLHERLGKCYKETGQLELASNAFEKALLSLKDSGLETQKKNQLSHNIYKESKNNSIIWAETAKQVSNKTNYLYSIPPPVIPENDRNPIYTCASKAFSIVDNDSEGRHAIATRDIPTGEVIIVEKPFTSICLSSSFDTHCYSCLSRYKISYPCRSCATVRYCSVQCEEQCWNSFHCYECQYLNLLTHDDIGLGHLAFKMIVQVGLNGLSSCVTTDNGGLGLNSKSVYDSSDYDCVYSLVGNSHLRKSADLFRRSLVAIYLANILSKTGFIQVGEDSRKDYIIVSSHLLKQIQMLPCNAHEVSELQLEGNDVANSELKEIGSAAYTTLSLLNHTCDPSVVRHCYGDVCVLRAIKYIKKGEPIIDNYGHLYPVEERDNRQKNLKEQYYFECGCQPCSEGWPMYNELPQDDPQFICDCCHGSLVTGVCSKCDIEDNEVLLFNGLQSDYLRCMEDVLNTGSYTDNLPTLFEYLNLLSKKAKLPVVHFNNCQEIVKLCFGLQGNYVKLKDLVDTRNQRT